MKKWRLTTCFAMAMVVLCGCQERRSSRIVESLRRLEQATTCEFVFTKMALSQSTTRISWVIELNETKFLAYADALVRTRIPLAKIRSADLKISGNQVELVLPAVELEDFVFPYGEYVFDKQFTDDSFLRRLSAYDQEEMLFNSGAELKEALDYFAIKEISQNKTKTLLTSLFEAQGFVEIYIEFKEGKLSGQITEGG